jgi:hypothetical protein
MALSPEPEPIGLRDGLRRLATGLIAYGAIGIVIAAIGLVAVFWLSGRIGAIGDPTTTQLSTIADTLDETATALTDASATAASFSGTLDSTAPAVRQVATAIGAVEGSLRSIEERLGRVQILGNRPLEDVGGQFGQMASHLEGLDAQLGSIADNLEGNREALTANAGSLATLGERLSAIADKLRSGGVTERLDDLQAVVTLLSLLLVIWVALPAIGALWLGWWLRRVLGGD